MTDHQRQLLREIDAGQHAAAPADGWRKRTWASLVDRLAALDGGRPVLLPAGQQALARASAPPPGPRPPQVLEMPELAAALEAADVPLCTLRGLVQEELLHLGQARRHGLPARIDELLGSAAGQDPPVPLGEAICSALEVAEQDLRTQEADAARQDWHGEQARGLAERTRARITELRAALPQQHLWGSR